MSLGGRGKTPAAPSGRSSASTDRVWPPCDDCGSDGHPADLERSQLVHEDPDEYAYRYRCLACDQKLPEPDRLPIELATALLTLRSDPTSRSYRGRG